MPTTAPLLFPCENDNHHAAVAHMNQVLQTIVSWGRRWQVDLAPDRTQLKLISRRQRTLIPTVLLERRALPLQASITILGVEVSDTLTFNNHLRNVAKKAARRLSCVRCISHLLDARGISTLYVVQVRSVMGYAILTWSSYP